MLLLIHIFFLINFTLALDYENVERTLRSTAVNVYESFRNMFVDIKQFLQCKYRSLLHRRAISKTAFHKFISESGNKSYNLPCEQNTVLNKPKKNETNKLLEISQVHASKTYHKPQIHQVPLETHFRQSLEMEMTRLITSHGYSLETHTALTGDGYMIALHRIHTGKPKGRKKRKVLLHHGILGSSQDWVLLGSNKALPYLLWLSGYDVWLINARGNKFSKTHSTLPVNSDEFWNFSFHEIGIYDLPAAIDYIKDLSDSDAELHYIGYSMGATTLLVLLDKYPRYNKMLTSAILIAPLAFMHDVKGPLRFLADFGLGTNIYNGVDYFGDQEFLNKGTFPDVILNKYCVDDYILCFKPILLLANGGKKILNQNVKNDIITYASGDGSGKTLKHYTQLVISGQFQMFDYGPDGNLNKYAMRSPPNYRLGDVTLPTAIITSTDDWLCSIFDTASLLPFISNLIVHHVVQRNDFSHTDFLWADDTPQLVYTFILDILSKPKMSIYQNKEISRNVSS